MSPWLRFVSSAFVAASMRLPLCAQVVHPSGPLPSYEVATIKIFDGAPPPSTALPSLPRDEVRMFVSAKILVAIAYNVKSFANSAIVGGPSWIDDQIYQIHGKINGTLSDAMQQMPSEERRRQTELMDQSLLADRFKLKVHFETKELPLYALVVAKSPKLKQADPSESHSRIDQTAKGQEDMELKADGCTAEDLATWVAGQPEVGGLAVVDQTGLSGRYDITLDWTPSRRVAANPDIVDTSIFTALREQLGLRLVRIKGPGEVVVIDHIEKPSDN